MAKRRRITHARTPQRGRRGTPTIQRQMANQTQKVLRTGQRFDKFDQIRQRHFWSSYYFDTSTSDYINAGRYTVFTTPVGSNGQGFPSGQVITDRESNWKSQNRIPDNQNFEITEIGCSVIAADFGTVVSGRNYETRYQTASAMSNFFNSAVLSITYLTNSVPLGLLSDFAQSAGPSMGAGIAIPPGITVDATNVPQAVNSAFTNGFAAPGLRRRFKIPILLQHGESFNFTIELPRSTFVGIGTGSSQAGAGAPFLVRVDFFATESFVEKS